MIDNGLVDELYTPRGLYVTVCNDYKCTNAGIPFCGDLLQYKRETKLCRLRFETYQFKSQPAIIFA